MKKFLVIAGAAAALTFASAGGAFADACTGHSHDTGTVVGGVGGAAIGGLASRSVVGAVAGGVVGALAGNAIDRSQDCSHQAAREERRDERDAYDQGYSDRAAQEGSATVVQGPPPDVTVYRE